MANKKSYNPLKRDLTCLFNSRLDDALYLSGSSRPQFHHSDFLLFTFNSKLFTTLLFILLEAQISVSICFMLIPISFIFDQFLFYIFVFSKQGYLKFKE